MSLQDYVLNKNGPSELLRFSKDVDLAAIKIVAQLG